MAKQSKRNRRRMRQGGFGGGFSVVRRVPIRVQRNLPHAPTLSADADERLRVLEYAARTSVREASIAFRMPVPTIYRWRQRYRPDDLTSLECRSRRPNRTRRTTWTAAQEGAVLARQAYPRMGKLPLQILLARQGIRLSASMIGRMLDSLRRRKLLREPHAVRVRTARPQRPSATRVPKDKRQPTEPGALIQLDTMHLRPLPGVERRQFTAIDVVSRVAVVGVRATASAGTARSFLDDLIDRMPFPVQAIQVDGDRRSWAGSRWRAGIGASPCRCCRPAAPSSMAGSNGSTGPPAASFGSATTESSTCRPCRRLSRTGRTRTIRSDLTKPSGTRRLTPLFVPSNSQMYRTRTGA